MKKAIIFILFTLIVLGGISWAQENESQNEPEEIFKYNVSTAYAYRAEQLVVSKSDLDGSFYLGIPPETDIKVLDIKAFAGDADFKRDMYGPLDVIYISKGETAGIKKGQLFAIHSVGRTVPGYGVHIVQKGVGVVKAVYTNQAELELTSVYRPVEKGDFLVEYKDVAEISKLKVSYEECIIPEAGESAKVVFSNLLAEIANMDQDSPGPENFVVIDMGKDRLNPGEYILFYRFVKPGLPPVIVGCGVAVHTAERASTIKILDAVGPVETGSSAVVLAESKIVDGAKDGEIPIVRRVTDLVTGEDEQMLTLDVLFKIDSAGLEEGFSEDLVKIKTFIEGKKAFAVVLKGFSCSIGSEERNLALSQQRVEAIKNVLMGQLEIGEDQIEMAFYGEKDSVYDNSIESERRKNRLVRIVVVAK